MPAEVDRFVEARMKDPSFYGDKPEEERKSIAFALANKLHNEGKLKGSFWEEIMSLFKPNPVTASDHTVEFSQINAPTQITIEASGQGDILVFRSAVLARSEVNRNGDEITPEGIEQLATSIGGRPVDIDHDESRNIGAFTAGRVADDGKTLSVDGFIWIDRYPTEGEGVKNGTHQLSVEANADLAECSECHGKFSGSHEYCNHLLSRKTSKVTRKLYGLKAKGGAVTKRPAGTQTKFDPAQIYFVANHQEGSDLEAKWFSPLTEGELDDGDFAWLSNAYKAGKEPPSTGRKLPYKVHGKVNETGWKAAWTRAHQEGTGFSGGPSQAEVIAKLKRDKPKGVEVSESEREELMATIKCPKCGHEMEAAHAEPDADDKARAALQAQLDTLKTETDAKIAQLTSELSEKNEKVKASQADLQAAYTKITEAEGKAKAESMKLRRAVLATVSEDEWKKQEKAISEMTDDAFTLYATTYNRHQFALSGRPLMRMPDPSLAASEHPDKEPLTL